MIAAISAAGFVAVVEAFIIIACVAVCCYWRKKTKGNSNTDTGIRKYDLSHNKELNTSLNESYSGFPPSKSNDKNSGTGSFVYLNSDVDDSEG